MGDCSSTNRPHVFGAPQVPPNRQAGGAARWGAGPARRRSLGRVVACASVPEDCALVNWCRLWCRLIVENEGIPWNTSKDGALTEVRGKKGNSPISGGGERGWRRRVGVEPTVDFLSPPLGLKTRSSTGHQ